MTKSTTPEVPRALLVSIRTREVSSADAAASLVELERLVTTLGFRVIARESQARAVSTGATGVGAGKLRDLARYTGGEGGQTDGLGAGLNVEPTTPSELATVVVFDCELRPSQIRHLENALGCEVLDRTGVIIEIFSRHAKTRTARLQVEIARLNYISPRLREAGPSGERQSGRGSGESALATGRRAVRDRLAELRRELERIQAGQSGHREERSAAQPSVALVGYTNAGKSSLMRALTGSGVLIEDKLFATLDTTVRSLKPETKPRILVSDTVGFIQRLPHDLVASFRSTLDEALNASLLLYVVDASDPAFRTQLETVSQVLREVGVWGTPKLLVMNKVDLLSGEEERSLKKEFPEAKFVSSRRTEDVGTLHANILGFFERGMEEKTIFAPFSVPGLVGEIRGLFRVLEERHDENGTYFRVRGRPEDLKRFR